MKKLKPIIFGCLFNLLAIIVLVIYLKNNKFDADVFLTLVISILALGYFDV